MSHVDPSLTQQLAYVLVERQQPQQVGHGHTGTPDAISDSLVGHAEFVNQTLQGGGLFERI